MTEDINVEMHEVNFSRHHFAFNKPDTELHSILYDVRCRCMSWIRVLIKVISVGTFEIICLKQSMLP
jgi:hypothetical protein